MVKTTWQWGTSSRNSYSAQSAQQKLPLLMAAGAQPTKLAREGHEELLATIRAAYPRDAGVEEAAVEVAVDRRLNAATQYLFACWKRSS